MLDTILEHPFFLNRHRQAPLLKERESFLGHLQQQGTSRKALRNLSAELLQVVRLLKLTKTREVSLEEIRRAARCWARQQRANPKAHSYGNSASSFIYAAKKWLRFHGRLKLPSAPPIRFADQLSSFAQYMTEEQGLSPYSVRSHCAKTAKFLEWFGERHRLLRRARIEDVDEFLAIKGTSGWNRTSVSVAAQALPAFFRYAETRGWCATGFAKGIQGPKIYKYEGLPEGPSWREVRKLLRSVKGSRPVDLRARAVLSLLVIYGLRSGEVSRLLLSDFDWREASECSMVVPSRPSDAPPHDHSLCDSLPKPNHSDSNGTLANDQDRLIQIQIP
jgi:integrase